MMNGRHTWGGPLRWWLAIFVFLTLPASAAAQDEDTMERPEVEKLRIVGVQSVSKSDLKDGLATRATECKSILLTPFCLVTDHRWVKEKAYLDRDELQLDVLRVKVFYWRRGWRHVTVDTAVTEPDDDGEVAVSFTITEGEPTRVSSIRVAQVGREVLPEEVIGETMRLRAGQPLDLLALDTSVVRLREVLFDRGHADAEVRVDTIIVDTAQRAAAVRLTIEPNWQTRVGSIDVRGLDDVSRGTVLNSIPLEPGGIFSREKVLESQRALYESGLFRQALINVPAEQDSTKDIEIDLREAPMREMRISGGFNTVDFIQVENRFTKYNFLGGGRRLDTRIAVGNLLAPQLNGIFPFHDVTPGRLTGREEDLFLRPNWQVSAEFTQPWWLSIANTIGLSAFAHRRSAPGIYIDRGFGGSATFTRRVAARSPLSLSYRFEVTEVEAGDVYFCQSFGVCENTTIDALRRRQRLSPLSLSFFTDRSNDLFWPTKGFQLRADAEHASSFTFSDFRYNRFSAEGAHYFALGNGALAARLRGGWVRNLASTAEGVGAALGSEEVILHPRKRFYAGGSQSVRGYGENQLGPRVLTVSPQALTQPRVDAAGDSIPGCTDGEIAARTCNPAGVPASAFQPRPTGGTALIEASVEYRFPIWEELKGAVFIDGAFVGEGALQDVTKGTGAITPGFGVRYATPAGVIRVDLGIRPKLKERLPVVTQVADTASGRPQIVRLNDKFVYDPLEGSSGFLRQVLDRLQLHLSIGQAF